MSREPEFRDYLLALSRRRLALFIWVVACATAAFVYTQLQPVAYLATATIVKLPPELETELTPPGLTLRTYETLLLSDDMIAGVARRAGVEGLTADTLRRSLSVKFIPEEQGRASAPAPLLMLSATAKTRKDAEKIANLWAGALIEKSTSLRSAQTTEAVKTLEGLVTEARVELERADARITEFNAVNNVSFLQSKVGVVGEKLKAHQSELLDASAKLESLKVMSDRRQKLLAMIERNNRWIGAIRPEELAGAVRPPAKKSGNFFPDSAAGARRNLLDTERDIIKYRDKFDVEIAKQEKESLDKILTERREELDEVVHDMSAKKPLVEETRARLKELPQFVELSKAIEDDALWMRLSQTITAADAKALSEMKLKTQVMNPIYFDTMRSFVTMEAEYNSLGEKKKYLVTEVDGLAKRLRALNQSLDQKVAGIDYLQRLKDVELKNYDTLAARYNTIRDNLADDMQQMTLVAASVAQLNARVRQMTAEFNALLKEANRLSFELSRYNTERDTVAESFKMLSQKSEEARIARAYETADVKIAARAVAPEAPLPRGRAKRAAAAAAVALALGIAFIIASEFSRLTLAGGDGEKPGSGSRVPGVG